MGRLKPKNTFTVKTGLITAAFSLLITAVFAVILFVFQYRYVLSVTDSVMLYPLTDMDLQSPNGNITISPDRITGSNKIYLEAAAHFTKQFLPFAVIFCIFVFASFLALRFLLDAMQKKQIENLTRSVADLDSEANFREHPTFAAAVEDIRKQYQNSLEDFKRLNSYLSHEQKNALAILRTNAELSTDAAYLRNLDNLTAGIDDILTLAETNPNEAVGAVDVAIVCAEVCDSYSKLTDKITFFFDETANTQVAAKQRWIYRAISNLVDNAVKYGNGKPIEVSVKCKNSSIIVTVKDRGIGIAPDKQELIFKNRRRINGQNKDGYGIGLSLVSHVCDLCGGFVTLESEPDKGTTFYLSFPLLTED